MKKILRIYILILLIFFSFNVATRLNAESKDGEYDIEVSLLNAYEDKESMGSAALHSSAKLIVEGDSARLRISFVPMDAFGFNGYMGEFSANGIPATVLSTYDIVDSYNDPNTGTDSRMKGRLYPKTVEIPVDLSTNIINCSVYVPVMAEMASGEQKVRLKLYYPESFSKKEIKKENSEQENLSDKKTENSDNDSDKAEKTRDAKGLEKDDSKEEKENQETEYYSVPVSLWHSAEEKESMGNNAMEQYANLLIKGDKMILYIGSKMMKVSDINASIISLYYDDGNEYLKAHPHSFEMKVEGYEELRPEVFGIPLKSKETFLNVMVDPKVDVMGDDPIKARLRIDFENQKKISKNDATLILKAENGRKKPKFNSGVSGKVSDKGVVMEFDKDCFEKDFTFYSNVITGEKLKKIRDEIGKSSTVKAFKLSALSPLEKIPYNAKPPFSDLRESYQPKKQIKIKYPIDEKIKNIKLYMMDNYDDEIEYDRITEGISFNTEKLGNFVILYSEENNSGILSNAETKLNSSVDKNNIPSKTVYMPAKNQKRENSGIIILFVFITVLFLSCGIYYSKKYFSVLLRELAYNEELKIKMTEKINKKEEE